MSRPQKPMRQAMPRVADFIDACAAEWGGKTVGAIIRAGLDGQPVFHASEGGHEIGTRIPPPSASYTADELLASSPRGGAAPGGSSRKEATR